MSGIKYEWQGGSDIAVYTFLNEEKTRQLRIHNFSEKCESPSNATSRTMGTQTENETETQSLILEIEGLSRKLREKSVALRRSIQKVDLYEKLNREYKESIEEKDDQIEFLNRYVREWIGRTLKFQYLSDQILRIDPELKHPEGWVDIVDCFRDIEVPDVGEEIKEEFVPTTLTNVAEQEVGIGGPEAMFGWEGTETEGLRELMRLFQSIDNHADNSSNLVASIGQFLIRGITDLRTLKEYLENDADDGDWLEVEDEYCLLDWFEWIGRWNTYAAVARYEDVVRVEQGARGEWYEERYPTIQELESITTIQRKIRGYLCRKRLSEQSAMFGSTGEEVVHRRSQRVRRRIDYSNM